MVSKKMVGPHFLNIEFLNSEKVVNASHPRILPFAESPLYFASIYDSKLLTCGEDVNRVYNLILDVQDVNFEFEPGDTIGVLPCNDDEEVEEILDRLGLKDVADKTYELSISKDTSKKNPKIPIHIPKHGTIRDLLRCRVDIRNPPKKVFLQALAFYSDSEDKNRINFLCSKEGSNEYIRFISDKRSLLDTLNSFLSCHPPIEILLEHLPPLQPRPYSISSSPLIGKFLRITFSVVGFKNDTRGVCTSWLENLIRKTTERKNNISNGLKDLKLNTDSSDLIPFYFRKAKIRFPKDPLTPLIMIGPGTGVAPFVGFLQNRTLKDKTNIKYGPSWLFFGCRYSDRDFIFKEELNQFLKESVLTKLFICFSREGRKEYVQDLILQHGEELTRMICDQNALVYVCGDEKNMMKDVKSVIASCLVKFRDFNLENSGKYIENMQKNMKYLEDSWI